MMGTTTIVALITAGFAFVGSMVAVYFRWLASKNLSSPKLAELKIDYLIKKKDIIHRAITITEEIPESECDDFNPQEIIENNFNFAWNRIEMCMQYLPSEKFQGLERKCGHLNFILAKKYMGTISEDEKWELSRTIVSFPVEVNRLLKEELDSTAEQIKKIIGEN